MAIEETGPSGRSPVGGSGEAETTATRRALASALGDACRGDVRFDEYSRVLYATDGSIYGAEPAGVVFPRDAEDVRAAVRTAVDHGVPVLPRGAGSSLAGQAVGPGCVVLDLSRHVDRILSIDPDERRARVQPGVVQDDLDEALAPHGLQFAPDPASANRATIGGGIGNNSTGAHSVRYGITDAYVEACEVVLANGSVIETRDVALDSPEWERIVSKDDREAHLYRTVRGLVEDNAAEIEARYPTLKRCVSGYNLQKVIRTDDSGDRTLNLSKLVVGAEGTLGVVTEATLSLVTRPAETALLVACYDDLLDAMAAVPGALSCDASAVELMDEAVFDLAADSPEYAEYAAAIPDGTAAALMVEFDSEVVDDLDEALSAARDRLVDDGGRKHRAADEVEDIDEKPESGGDGARRAAFDSIEAFSAPEQEHLWKLRKAAIPLLMSLEGDPKPYPFVEDASVPPDELAAYVAGFQEILDDHGTEAAYFAHAGVGTLHVRPILTLKDADGIDTMRSIAEDVTDLVLDHHGAFSGEHGDGLARTEFNPKLYGSTLWAAFQDLKTAFDPDWRMNPGTVVYRDDDPTDIRDHLRYGADYAALEPRTTLDFADEGGFSHLVELCNGCGTCRQRGSDVMCPTYRATGEELATTRGRANLLRAAISGDLDPEELHAERFQREVIDLCIGCKGCQSDCPTGVDLAKLKAEVKHQYHEREGVGLRERLFSNVDSLARVASTLAPLSNAGPSLPGARTVLERGLGIAPERTLPTFARRSFVSWFEARGGPRVPADRATDRVLLFPDTFVNYSAPEIGRAAVSVLEAADVRVAVPECGPTGRAAYSQGRLALAAERAANLCASLGPAVEEGYSVCFLEPSDAAMVADEYGSLLDGSAGPDDLEADGDRLADGAYGFAEYLDRHRVDERLAFDAPDETLAYHGHCHQRALGRDHHAVGVLRRAGYAVDPLDSGCCGMAGSFGYEAEHHDLSLAIGRLLVDTVAASDGEVVIAPGASCRSQLADLTGDERPRHPAEALADALATDPR